MNTVLLGILFAVVGALCGVCVVKTYSGANFVPSSGCSVQGSSVVPNSSLLTDEFVDASFFAAQWTTMNTDANHTLTLQTGNSRIYMLLLSCVADPNKNVGFRSGQFTGNFDVWMDAETLTYANYVAPGITFYVDDNNWFGFGMQTNNTGATDYPAIRWKLAGVGGYNQQSISARARRQIRLARTGTVFTAYYRNATGDSWTQILQLDKAVGFTGCLHVGIVADGALASCYLDIAIHSLAFTVGGPSVSASSVFTVCDNAAQTIDAGAVKAFDKATFGVTTTNSPALSFRTSDQDADGAPSWSSSKTLAQLQAESNSGKQFMAIEVTASKNGLAYQFDQLDVSTYNLDVTPPAIPSIDWVMSLVAGAGFAVKLTAPADVDFAYCELEVQHNAGAWQNVDAGLGLGGAGYMKFVAASTNPQPSGQTNALCLARWGYTAGDTIAVRVRAVDNSGNASAWVACDPIVLQSASYIPVLVNTWYAEWPAEAWSTAWTVNGNTTEVNAVLQETIGTTWSPEVVLRGIPATAGQPSDFTCKWALKQYADDAVVAVGPVTGTCVLGDDGVSWKLNAVVPPASQPVSPALVPGRYVQYFRIANADNSMVKEFGTTLELLPAGVIE